MTAFFLHALIELIHPHLKESARHPALFGALELHPGCSTECHPKQRVLTADPVNSNGSFTVLSAFSAAATVKRFLSFFVPEIDSLEIVAEGAAN